MNTTRDTFSVDHAIRLDMNLMIQKALTLCSILAPEDQIAFLEHLVSVRDLSVKKKLLENALQGRKKEMALHPRQKLTG